MRIKKGLFRVWIVATVLALIGLPIAYIEHNQSAFTCYQVIDVEPPNLAVDLFKSPGDRRVCTVVVDYGRTYLDAHWSQFTSITISVGGEFGVGPTVLTFKPAQDSLSLMEYQAIAASNRQNISGILRNELWIMEVSILVIAVVTWWVGRFFGFILTWIWRGFKPDPNT